jgi:mRNA interferase HigB
MILIGKKLLYDYKKDYPDTKSDLDSLEAEIENAEWKNPHELKSRYPQASIIGGRQVIFNICRNKHRLWVEVTYNIKIVATVKIGTHKEYDKWEIKK